MYKAKVIIKRRPSILDPQGKGAEKGAKLLGFNNISKIRINKEVDFEIDAMNEEDARKEITDFCSKLLANPIMEDFEIFLENAQ